MYMKLSSQKLDFICCQTNEQRQGTRSKYDSNFYSPSKMLLDLCGGFFELPFAAPLVKLSLETPSILGVGGEAADSLIYSFPAS